MQAVRLVKQRGWSMRKVAKYFGAHPSTIMRWCRRDKLNGLVRIPTRSSRPKHHPRQLSEMLVAQIVSVRRERGRSAEVVQAELSRRGVHVSLSSVKRTLDRWGLTKKRGPKKRYHPPMDRPKVQKPGDLVQVDTVHRLRDDGSRVYVFTLIDVCTRYAYARAYPRISAQLAVDFVRRAQRSATFSFRTIQSDHGSEFSTYFTERVHVPHRHSRVRRPNDNAHLERFNRTIQEECIDKLITDPVIINKALPEYLKYYNEERLHFGLKLQTPQEVLRSY